MSETDGLPMGIKGAIHLEIEFVEKRRVNHTVTCDKKPEFLAFGNSITCLRNWRPPTCPLHGAWVGKTIQNYCQYFTRRMARLHTGLRSPLCQRSPCRTPTTSEFIRPPNSLEAVIQLALSRLAVNVGAAISGVPRKTKAACMPVEAEPDAIIWTVD